MKPYPITLSPSSVAQGDDLTEGSSDQIWFLYLRLWCFLFLSISHGLVHAGAIVAAFADLKSIFPGKNF